MERNSHNQLVRLVNELTSMHGTGLPSKSNDQRSEVFQTCENVSSPAHLDSVLIAGRALSISFATYCPMFLGCATICLVNRLATLDYLPALCGIAEAVDLRHSVKLVRELYLTPSVRPTLTLGRNLLCSKMVSEASNYALIGTELFALTIARKPEP